MQSPERPYCGYIDLGMVLFEWNLSNVMRSANATRVPKGLCNNYATNVLSCAAHLGGPVVTQKNAKHWVNVGSMLDHRLRRLPNIDLTSNPCLAFLGTDESEVGQ